jgi:hypothetical protein
MPLKRRLKKRICDYKPAFTPAEHKLMQNYGGGDLMDEIWLNRVLLLRTTDKMNQELERLTFRDHLDALRAVAYSTARIANLMEIREELFSPYQELEKYYSELFGEVQQGIDTMGETIYGEEKWDEMMWEVMRKAIDEPAPKISLKSDRSKRRGSS